MAELVDEIIDHLAPWPTAVSLALELGFDSAKSAATGAQLSVPLIVAGMTHRLDDPSAGHGLTDVLKTVDPSSLPDLARILAERSYEPAGSDATNLVFGTQYQRVIAAVAAESGCEQAHAAAVLAPTTWLTMATIVRRYGIGHDRQSLLGLIGREHRDLVTAGWEQWMSIVDPEPIVVPAPMAAPTLEPSRVLADPNRTVSAETTYPPPAGRATRAEKPAARTSPVSHESPSSTPSSPMPVHDDPTGEQRRPAATRNPFPDAEPSVTEGGTGIGPSGAKQSSASADDDFFRSPQEPERPARRVRTLLAGAALLLLLIGGALAWFWYQENQAGDEVSTSGGGGEAQDAETDAADDATSAEPDSQTRESQTDVSVPSVVSMNVILDDPTASSDATANAALQFNREDGELCYDIETTGLGTEIQGRISRGDLGSEGVPLVELGTLTESMISCAPIEAAAMTTMLAAPGSHYLSVFVPDGSAAIRSQLNGMTRPPTDEGLQYDPEGGGAFVRLQDGTLQFEGEVPNAETANLLLAEFAGFGNGASENNLQVVDSAPLPSGRIVVEDELFFESGSAEPGASQRATLEQFASFLIARPDRKVLIIGHTDASGDPASNLELSRLRARAVRDVLIELGVDKRLVRADGVGSSEAIATNDTPEGRQKNRRIEFRIEPAGVDS